MPSEPKPYWGYKYQPFVTIGTDEGELRTLADAIVRGASIAHAQITDLRDLIEAVQRHSGVALRPPKDAEKISESSKGEPTALVIHGGCVYRCACSKLDIRVTLTAATAFGKRACFDEATFVEQASFDGATFGERANFYGATFGERASFDGAIFGEKASFVGARFGERVSFENVGFGEQASFLGAIFCERANFGGASFGEQARAASEAVYRERTRFDATFFRQQAIFDFVTFGNYADFESATFCMHVSFERATFGERASFNGARFGKQASFKRATFGKKARFELAGFSRKVDFAEAKLPSAGFFGAVLRRANFELAEIDGIDVSRADLVGARGLFGPHRATAASQLINEHSVQLARFHRKWDLMPWTRLRVIGALRLFGVSYGSIIVIVIYVKLAKWYNTSFAVQVREDAQQKIAEGIDWRWREILAKLPDLPVPGHLATQLIMILVLAIGATFYQLFCPDLVKEATETRWTRQMNQLLIEYRSAMWSRIVWRYLSALFLVTGGLYTVGYLSIRLWDALRYLFIH